MVNNMNKVIMILVIVISLTMSGCVESVERNPTEIVPTITYPIIANFTLTHSSGEIYHLVINIDDEYSGRFHAVIRSEVINGCDSLIVRTEKYQDHNEHIINDGQIYIIIYENGHATFEGLETLDYITPQPISGIWHNSLDVVQEDAIIPELIPKPEVKLDHNNFEIDEVREVSDISIRFMSLIFDMEGDIEWDGEHYRIVLGGWNDDQDIYAYMVSTVIEDEHFCFININHGYGSIEYDYEISDSKLQEIIRKSE